MQILIFYDKFTHAHTHQTSTWMLLLHLIQFLKNLIRPVFH